MKRAYLYINYPNITVLKTYMDVIKDSLERNNFSCEYVDSLSGLCKKSLIVFPMAIDAFKYYLKGFKNFILWQQGATSEESFMRHHNFIRKEIINWIDRFMMKRARFVFYVSRQLLSYYDRKHVFEKKSYIMPCFNETHLHFPLTQKDYSVPSFAYVGSLDVWQCFEQTISMFSRIQTFIPNASIKVLTWDCDKANETLNNHHVKNFVVKRVSKDEVKSELIDVNYGFIIRENNIVNNVATPTKFSSYLSCGVLPIYSDYIQDFHDNFSSSEEFCSLKSPSDIKTVLRYIKAEKKHKNIEKLINSIFRTYYSPTYHSSNAASKMQLFIHDL